MSKAAGMSVTVLVDAYNLYYADGELCGRGATGWRWLHIRSLAVEVSATSSTATASRK